MKPTNLNNYRIDFIGDKILFGMLKELIETANNGALVKAIKKRKKRTNDQNATLHCYLREVAEHCKERGFTVEHIYKNPLDIPLDETQLKKYTKQVVKFITKDHDNTSKLTTEQFSTLAEVLQKKFAEELDAGAIPFFK